MSERQQIIEALLNSIATCPRCNNCQLHYDEIRELVNK